MITRLTHIGASFLIVFGAYWLYALSVVPLIEPSVEVVRDDSPTPDPVDDPRKRPDVQRDFLKEHFPPGSWELAGPKVFENDRGQVLVKDYHPLPDGRVELIPCTMIFFPKGQPSAVAAESEPIIMQAPEGAILEFDPPFDPKRGSIGKLVAGQLRGKITIHSRPSRPGAGDDLHIVTRDVQLAEDRVWTPHPVDFSLGLSHGTGREMQISLSAPGEGEEAKSTGFRVGSVQWLELERDVKMHMQLAGSNLLPGDEKVRQQAKTATGQKVPKAPDPPVDIQCQGPFRFDLAQNVATFSRQVDVLRLNAEGPSDQMTCELLSIYFAPRASETAAAEEKGTKPVKEDGSNGGMTNLEARLVEASGDPVIVNAPSTGSTARCQRLEYEVKTGRIVLEGSQEVQLHQGTNEIRTRRLDYRPGATGGLGQLEAAGPGMLWGSVAENPAQKYQARWTRELSVRPDQRNHVVSLVGAAQVRATDVGTLNGEEIYVWLSENPREPRPQRDRLPTQMVSFSKPESSGMRAERMTARGNVHVDSPQLTGDAGLLEVWIEDAPQSSGADADPRRPGLPPNGRRPNVPPNGAPAPRLQRFDVGGARVKILAVRGRTTEASDLAVEGNAHFTETRTAQAGEKPLVVKGDNLHVAQANTPAAKLTVAGKPAYVEARGFSLSGGRIEVERATNRSWVDGPGRMTLPVKQDLDGHALLQARSLEITWQGGMKFDGQTAIFDRSVVVRGDHQTLGTSHMEVKLKRRVDFGDPKLEPAQGGQTSIDWIACRDECVMDSRSFDERGQTSIDHMEARDLSVNQTTGAIAGRGPGFMTSVRRGSTADVLAAGPPKAAPAAPDKDKTAAPQFNYLKVQFEGPISGNLTRKEVTFSDQVQSIYGPVTGWDQKLEGDDPDKLGPQGVLLNCDQLTVRTTPGADKASKDAIELEASGHTVVEGSTFTTRSERVTYARLKGLLVLEGTAQADAELYRQAEPGAATQRFAARRIMYWPLTKRMEVEDVRFLDMRQLGGAAPQTPDTTPNGGAPNRTGKNGRPAKIDKSTLEESLKRGKTVPSIKHPQQQSNPST